MESAGRSKRDDEYDAPHRDSPHSPRNESSEALEGIEDSSVDEVKSIRPFTACHEEPVPQGRIAPLNVRRRADTNHYGVGECQDDGCESP